MNKAPLLWVNNTWRYNIMKTFQDLQTYTETTYDVGKTGSLPDFLMDILGVSDVWYNYRMTRIADKDVVIDYRRCEWLHIHFIRNDIVCIHDLYDGEDGPIYKFDILDSIDMILTIRSDMMKAHRDAKISRQLPIQERLNALLGTSITDTDSGIPGGDNIDG